jgi:hypothetical protein
MALPQPRNGRHWHANASTCWKGTPKTTITCYINKYLKVFFVFINTYLFFVDQFHILFAGLADLRKLYNKKRKRNLEDFLQEAGVSMEEFEKFLKDCKKQKVNQ